MAFPQISEQKSSVEFHRPIITDNSYISLHDILQKNIYQVA